ncbi:MAG TPA: hypothetical protein VF243_01585, partial [Nitrosospira sp.]
LRTAVSLENRGEEAMRYPLTVKTEGSGLTLMLADLKKSASHERDHLFFREFPKTMQVVRWYVR